MNEGPIRKLKTGIDGFDHIAEGGLPEGRSTLVAGTSGSGKTIFALQYLVRGVRHFDQPGVIVTFEESVPDLIQNVEALGWNLRTLIDERKVAVVDASSDPAVETVEAGAFDFMALLSRIEHAVKTVGARRVILDSVGAVFANFRDSAAVRRELRRVVSGLRSMGVTVLITVERAEEYGQVSRYGVEEFVADNVVVLRNQLDNEKRRRTIEILKVRGATHQKGEYPFTIDSAQGVTIIPLSAMQLTQKSSAVRISSGNVVVDEMCGGGMFRDSIILVSGATGTGKTLMVIEFMKAVIEKKERALLFAFEESYEQLTRNAAGWGVDLDAAQKADLLRVVCRYPETAGLEDHLIAIKREIESFQPARVAVDSLSALERVSSLKSFREFVIGVTSHIKQREIAGVFTNTTANLMGGESVTETHISTITDSIILLRYVELQGTMRRGITVLKMRGSWHDKDIREYSIDGTGMHVREPFRGINGILSGNPVHGLGEEHRRLNEMFGEEGSA